jgi:hypothetical protein
MWPLPAPWRIVRWRPMSRSQSDKAKQQHEKSLM